MNYIDTTIKEMKKAVPSASRSDCIALINDLSEILSGLRGPVPLDVKKTGDQLKKYLEVK